ncbi:MAG: GHKL domain-containing protein, partial [Akkermansiaceae bacterium]|nr:GHKL domain-containing protein [Akkermansiaceae bacterium]
LWILAWIDDGSSPYYAGLNLIMVGTVLIMRWRAGDGVINALFCIGGYLGVSLCLGHQPADIVVATFFLSVTAVFACVGLFSYNKLRFREFCLREEVAAQQAELAEGARDVEVKGQALNSALEEIKENEARLLEAEKMASLGRMSAGIVHEVNNPLNYAKTALHALHMYRDDVTAGEREDFEETVSDAEDGVNRVIRIVSDLRSFTKGETIMHEEVRVAETIEMARRLVARDLRGIEFKASIPESLMVAGNSNQLCQVFVNVIQNSVQALEEKGDSSDQPRLDISCGEVQGGQVAVTFRDNGPGIAPEDLEQVFDPFFTRREVGEGMGLGLSICHQIVESHGGKIEVVSSPGEFTEFRVVLPRYWDQARDKARPEHSDFHKVETKKVSIP